MEAASPSYSEWLEVRRGREHPTTVPLIGPLTVGRDIGGPLADGHLTIAGDLTVSRFHARFERHSIGWCVQSPKTTNGLFVNGERLADGASHYLRPGDEIRLGESTALIFHSLEQPRDYSRTQTAKAAPDLTSAERRVLLSLCFPLMEGDAFTPPAKVAAIAEQLYVTESAVKQHLTRLYSKFDIDDGDDRRVKLANAAMQRGSLRRNDLDEFRRSLR